MLTSRQLFGVKTPPAPPSLHDMIPIMELDKLELSVTVAVMSTLPPGVMVEVFALTAVTVGSGPFAPWTVVEFVDVEI